MDIDHLKNQLDCLETWHIGEESPPAIEPFLRETLRLLRKACEDGNQTAYAALAAFFDTPEDAPAGRVLKNLRASLRRLSDTWESELEDALIEEEVEPPTGGLFGKRKKNERASSVQQEKLRQYLEDVSRERRVIGEILEREGTEIERIDARNHPRLDNIKYLEDRTLLSSLSADLMKLYTRRRKALEETRRQIEDESLVRLKKTLEHYLGKRGMDLAAGITSLKEEDEIDILKKVYPGGPADLARFMDTTAADEEERELLLPRAFVFEDLVLLDDRAIHKVLRRVELTDLATALKGVDEEVREKIFRNLSLHSMEELKEDMGYMGPVRRKDVEKIQDRIVGTILEMEAEGEIYIARSEEDEVVI